MERLESITCVTSGREKKNPRTFRKVRGFRFLSSGARRGPVLEGPSRYSSMGRSSGSRFTLLAAPSHHACGVTVAISCGFRPRLQRRVRDGFAPSSLCPCESRIKQLYGRCQGIAALSCPRTCEKRKCVRAKRLKIKRETVA